MGIIAHTLHQNCNLTKIAKDYKSDEPQLCVVSPYLHEIECLNFLTNLKRYHRTIDIQKTINTHYLNCDNQSNTNCGYASIVKRKKQYLIPICS